MPSRLAYVVRIAVALAATTVLAALLNGVPLEPPWSRVWSALGVSATFSACIGLPASIAMPWLGRRVWPRFRFPLDWGVMIAALLVIAVAGSVGAIGVLIAAGLVAAGDFGDWLRESLRLAVIVTLSAGVLITIYETMRSELRQTTDALHAKERDEAEARRVAAEAQLASLEARVQPHFLFNTLNSIAALTHDDPGAAERMTTRLSALMRSSLEHEPGRLRPLADELALVHHYLEIERVRFGDRLVYEIDAPPAEGGRVPALVVQTLVENSVKHAVSRRREPTRIVVRASVANGRARVEVLDDGPGFDPAAAAPGHGLALVRARLQMLFGDEAALTMSRRDGFTMVAVEVPA